MSTPALSTAGEALLDECVKCPDNVTKAIGYSLFNVFDIDESIIFLKRLYCNGQDCEKYFGSIKRPPMYCNFVWSSTTLFYRCRTCQVTPSSALCVECFNEGDHEGHDYVLDKSTYGGCCDCGCPDAWKPSGYCKNHHGQPDIVRTEDFLEPEVIKIAYITTKAMFSRIILLLGEPTITNKKAARDVLSLARDIVTKSEGYREIMGRVFKEDALLMDEVLNTGSVDNAYGDLLTSYFLDLMYNMAFKYYFMEIYLKKYSRIATDVVFDEGSNFSKMEMEKFSAQVYNIPNFCTKASSENGMLQMLFKSMYDVLARCSTSSGNVDTTSHIIEQRKYNPLFIDVHSALGHLGVAYYLLTTPKDLSLYLRVLSLLQHMCSSVRRGPTDDHIPTETEEWISAFNLDLEFMRMSLIALTAFKNVVLGRKGLEYAVTIDMATTMSPSITTLTATLLSWLVGFGVTVSDRETKRKRIRNLTGEIEEETVTLCNVTPPTRGYSYHIPLHRLLTWLLRIGFRVGLSLESMLPISVKEALVMAYHPAKCIAVNSEVRAGMWNKNGSATVTRQAYIYRCSPLCANRMFSADVLLLQTIAVIVGPDRLVNLMMNSFEGLANSPLMKLIVNYKTFEDQVTQNVDDYKRDMILAEGFMMLILWVATERLGCGLSRRDNIRRAAVHALLRRPLSHSGLCEVLPCTGDDVDDHLKDILTEIADFTAPSPDQPGRYHIKDELFVEYEPYYPHYIQGDRQDTYEHFERFASAQRKSDKVYKFALPGTPLLQTHIRPIVDSLSSVWKVLVCDTTLTYLYIMIHNAAMSPASSTLPKSDNVLAIALHLLLMAVRVSRSSIKVSLGSSNETTGKVKKSTLLDDGVPVIFDCRNDVFSFAVTPVNYKTKQVSFMKRLFSTTNNTDVAVTCIELLVRLMTLRPDEGWIKITCTSILQELCFGSPVCLSCLRSILKNKVNASDVINLKSMLATPATPVPRPDEDMSILTNTHGLPTSRYLGDFADQGKGHAKTGIKKRIGTNGNVVYGDIAMDVDPIIPFIEREGSLPVIVEPPSDATEPPPEKKSATWKGKQEEIMRQFQLKQSKFMMENIDLAEIDEDNAEANTPHLGTTPRVNLSNLQSKYGTPFALSSANNTPMEPEEELERPVCVFCHGDNQDTPIGHLVHVVRSRMCADVKRPIGDVESFVKNFPRLKSSDAYDDDTKQQLSGVVEPVRYDGLPGDGLVAIDTLPGPKGWNGVLTLRKIMYERGDEGSGACVSGCGHWMHVTCMQRYLNTLIIKSYEGSQQFEGRRYLRIVHCHEFLCPLCKCLCNSIIPSASRYIPSFNSNNSDTFVPCDEPDVVQGETSYCLQALGKNDPTKIGIDDANPPQPVCLEFVEMIFRQLITPIPHSFSAITRMMSPLLINAMATTLACKEIQLREDNELKLQERSILVEMFANTRLVVSSYPWLITAWRGRLLQMVFSLEWDAASAVDVNSVLSTVLGLADVSDVVPNSPTKRPVVLPCAPYPLLCADPWSMYVQMLFCCCDDDANLRQLLESGQTGPAYPTGTGTVDAAGGAGLAQLQQSGLWEPQQEGMAVEESSSFLPMDDNDIDYENCHLHITTVTRMCILMGLVQAVVDYIVCHPETIKMSNVGRVTNLDQLVAYMANCVAKYPDITFPARQNIPESGADLEAQIGSRITPLLRRVHMMQWLLGNGSSYMPPPTVGSMLNSIGINVPLANENNSLSIFIAACPYATSLLDRWTAQLKTMKYSLDIMVSEAMGVIPRCPPIRPFSLVKLPAAFLNMLQHYDGAKCVHCDTTPQRPGICLFCGRLVCISCPCCWSGPREEASSHMLRHHGSQCLFLVPDHSTVLVLRDDRLATFGIYLDAYGEEDLDFRRQRPLQLSTERYDHIRSLIIKHGMDQDTRILHKSVLGDLVRTTTISDETVETTQVNV